MLVHPLTSYNPLRVEFAQWMSLAHDLLRARSLRAVLGYLFMPPGWAPDSAGFTTAELRARLRQSSAAVAQDDRGLASTP